MAEETIKVFLADRSPELLLLLREVLMREGIEVVDTARGGTEALEKLRRLRPDVLITDLLLPELDGMNLLRTLREEKRMPRTIVLSAFCNDHIAHSAALLGVEYYLPKPCGMDALCACVRGLSGGFRGASPTQDVTVRELLLRFPIPAHLSGYHYLCEGLERVMEDRSCLQGVTKVLYRDIARKYRTTGKCVERSMRAAIAKGWEKGSREQRLREFGSVFECFDRPPAITRFLSLMAEQLTLESSDRVL